MATKEALDERRRQVAELAYRGLDDTQIAKVLNVPLRAVRADQAVIRERMRAALVGMDPYQFLADTQALYEHLRNEALSDLHTPDVGITLRLASARAAADMQNRIVMLLQDVGALPKSLGTLRVLQEEQHELEKLGRLKPGELLELHEAAFGPLPADEKERALALDSEHAGVSDPDDPSV